MGMYVVRVDEIEASRNECESEGEALDHLNQAIKVVVMLSKSSIITLHEEMGKKKAPRQVGFCETHIDHSRLQISKELTRWLQRCHKEWFYEPVVQESHPTAPDVLFAISRFENEGYDEDNEDEYNRVQKELAQIVDLRGGLTLLTQLIDEPAYLR